MCHCHTCEKDYHHLGIARHRAMHRDNNETCTITYSGGNTVKHLYGEDN